jgi:hypothetical protein
MKTRVSFLLSAELVQRLDEASAKPGARKSDIIETALALGLADRVHNGDGALWRRLDQMSRQLERLAGDSEVGLETLALFIRYYLTITPPLPAADQEAARALGRERFEVFLSQVGRRLGGGASLAREARQARQLHTAAATDLYTTELAKPPKGQAPALEGDEAAPAGGPSCRN